MPWESLKTRKDSFSYCLVKTVVKFDNRLFKMLENLTICFTFSSLLTAHCIAPQTSIWLKKSFNLENVCLKTENVMLNHLIAWLIINYASFMPNIGVWKLFYLSFLCVNGGWSSPIVSLQNPWSTKSNPNLIWNPSPKLHKCNCSVMPPIGQCLVWLGPPLNRSHNSLSPGWDRTAQ